MPLLPNNTPNSSGVLFRGSLHAADLRSLFQQVNRNGRLDALKPYMETPSDAELEIIAGLVSRQIYQELDSPQGLVKAVQSAVEAKSFTAWNQALSGASRAADYRERAGTLLDAAADPDFPAIVKRDRAVLTDWSKTLLAAWSQPYANSKAHPEQTPEVTSAALVKDLQTMLVPPLSRKVIGTRAAEAIDSNLILPLAKVSRDARSETGVAAFEGLGYGLSQLLTAGSSDKAYANRLDQTLGFLHGIDRPTDGMFNVIASTLRVELSSLTYVAEALRPLYASVINENLRKHLATTDKAFWLNLVRGSDGKPGTSFKPFFLAARDALSELAGRERTDSDSDQFLFNLTLDFDAYALTRWAETIAASNLPAWKNLPEQDFTKTLWMKPAHDDGTVVDGTDKTAIAADFKLLGRDSLVAEAGRNGYGDFVYPFNGNDFPTLQDATQAALEMINNIRPYADPEPTLKLLAQQVLAPGPNNLSLIESLESPNLLQSLQKLLGAFGESGWQLARYWLFDKLALDHLSPNTRSLLLAFYKDKPDLAQRVGQLLDGLPLLTDLDRPVDGLPSPFAFYRRVLSATDDGQKGALGDVLSFASSAHLLTPNFPAVQNALADGSRVSRVLYGLSFLSGDEAMETAGHLREMFGKGGLSAHLDFAARLLQAHPQGIAAWLTRLNAAASLPAMPIPLRDWAYRFLASDDFPLLVQYVRDHGSRAGAADLARQLHALSRNGELREAFALLCYLRDDRLRDLGTTLKAWEASGELEALFATLEEAAAPFAQRTASE